jgi:seryl-tRNA(Sec) selenium transferase
MDFMLIQSYLEKIPAFEHLMHIPEIEELTKKFSKVAVEENINAILDKRHLDITTSKSEDDIKNMDFSMDFYIRSLKETLIEEREITSRKVLNLTGTMYSKHIGNKFYSKELLREFSENFSSYNTLNYDLKHNKVVSIKEEISNFLKSYNKDKDYLLLSSVPSAIYASLKSVYGQNENISKIICSIKESYTFANGSDILNTIKEAGFNLEVVGTINSLNSQHYENLMDNNSVILHSDLMGNKLEGLASLTIAEMEELRKKYEDIFVTDKVYLSTENDTIKRFAYSLSELSKADSLLILDLSKFEDMPESALVVGDKSKINKIKNSIYAPLFALSKESEILFYLNLKNKLSLEKSISHTEFILNKTEEDIKKSNGRLISLLEDELHGLAEIGIMEGPYFKIEEGVSYSDALNRELLVISPLTKDASSVEKSLRMSDPSILCLLNEGNLIFNLQLISKSEEKILAEKIIEALKG